MNRSLFGIALVCLFISCQKTDNSETLEGDLYYKLVEFRTFDAPDSVLSEIKIKANDHDIETLTDQQIKLYKHIKYLIDKDLLTKPYIRLKDDNGEISMLFLKQSDYKKLEGYKLSELMDSDKRIRIKAKVNEMDFNGSTAFNATQIISIKELKGKTDFEK